MDIDILKAELEVKDSPGLDPFDSRFIDIATLVQNGDYEEAALQAEEIIEDEIYDVRIIGYFLYGVFLEKGPAVLGDIFNVINLLLTDNWEAVGPVKNRAKHTKSIIIWFMKQLLKKLEYEEDKNSTTWEEWIGGVSSDEVADILDELSTLRKNLGIKFEDAASDILDVLMKLQQWLKSFQQIVYQEEEANEPESEADIDEEEELEEDDGELGDEEEEILSGDREAKRAEATVNIGNSSSYGVAVQGSFYLNELVKKLNVFEELVKDEKFLLAAIVIEDVQDIIENFDPRKYLPEIFSPFYRIYASNIKAFSRYDEYKDTEVWQVLKDAYCVNIDSFLELEVDNIENIDTEEDDEDEFDYDDD